MPVNLSPPENLLPVKGVRLATVEAGIRYQGRDDVVLLELAEGSHTAAVFTQNAFCAAPVTVAREHLSETATSRYLLINAGNANAGTGEAGLEVARSSCRLLAELAVCSGAEVLPFSTGVIGEALPLERLVRAFPAALADLDENNWLAASHGIMTTDTVAKGISRQIELNGETVTVTGIAKGSGMICPNMATLLAYVATDAAVAADQLQSLLEKAVAGSFNAITVDSDTSTNDSLVLVATGQSEAVIDAKELPKLQSALNEVCQYLAQAIVRDAEGATKFVTIEVDEAGSEAEAKEVAYTVAHSPLVKTALFASDPNWGRILAAVGRSSVENLDISAISITLGDVSLIEQGEPAPNYSEASGQAEMDKSEILIGITLGRGASETRLWTSDLSHEYVRINAEYRS